MPVPVTLPWSTGRRGKVFSVLSTSNRAPATAATMATTMATMTAHSQTAKPWRAPSKRDIRAAT